MSEPRFNPDEGVLEHLANALTLLGPVGFMSASVRDGRIESLDEIVSCALAATYRIERARDQLAGIVETIRGTPIILTKVAPPVAPERHLSLVPPDMTTVDVESEA